MSKPKPTITDAGIPRRATVLVEIDLSRAESVGLLDGFRSNSNVVAVTVASGGRTVRCMGKVTKVNRLVEEMDDDDDDLAPPLTVHLDDESVEWLIEAARHHPGGYGHVVDGLREALAARKTGEA